MRIPYPKIYEKAVRRVSDAIGTDPETAYTIILLTALLTDLNPRDERVIETIISDYGAEPRIA